MTLPTCPATRLRSTKLPSVRSCWVAALPELASRPRAWSVPGFCDTLLAVPRLVLLLSLGLLAAAAPARAQLRVQQAPFAPLTAPPYLVPPEARPPQLASRRTYRALGYFGAALFVLGAVGTGLAIGEAQATRNQLLAQTVPVDLSARGQLVSQGSTFNTLTVASEIVGLVGLIGGSLFLTAAYAHY